MSEDERQAIQPAKAPADGLGSKPKNKPKKQRKRQITLNDCPASKRGGALNLGTPEGDSSSAAG